MVNKMCTSRSIVCALFLVSLLCITDSINPGIQMRITQKGIQLAVNTAKEVIKRELSKQTFEEKGTKTGVEYHVRGMKVTEVDFPEVEFVPVAGVGMKGVMKGAVLGGRGNVWYEYSFGWFGFSDDVDFSLRISGIDISLVVSVGAVIDGRPQIGLGSCSADVDSVGITFEGSGFKQWIYNLFNGIIAYKMEKTLSKTLTNIICKQVEGRARKQMYTFPLIQAVDQWAAIDYRLTQPPTFTDTFVDTFFKGEFKSVKNPTQSSLVAPILKVTKEDEKMAYFWVSEYTLNTAGEVYQQSDALNLTIAEWDENIPLEIRNKLTTKTFEMGIPNLSRYGDLPISVQFVSYKTPYVAISENSIRLYLFADATFKIRQKNGKESEAFALRFDMDTDLEASVAENKIRAKITEFNYNAKVKHSNIGKIDITLLSIMKYIIEKSVINNANPKLQKGFPLPKVDMCEFKDMDLELQDKAIHIGTNAILSL